MDDLLQPERETGSSASMTTTSPVRMTGDLDQGLQQMAQSLGMLAFLFLRLGPCMQYLYC